jgi:hypothetical protein
MAVGATLAVAPKRFGRPQITGTISEHGIGCLAIYKSRNEFMGKLPKLGITPLHFPYK